MLTGEATAARRDKRGEVGRNQGRRQAGVPVAKRETAYDGAMATGPAQEAGATRILALRWSTCRDSPARNRPPRPAWLGGRPCRLQGQTKPGPAGVSEFQSGRASHCQPAFASCAVRQLTRGSGELQSRQRGDAGSRRLSDPCVSGEEEHCGITSSTFMQLPAFQAARPR